MNRTTIATTPQEIEALRDIWARSDIADVDADIDAFLTLVASAEQPVEPYVVHIRRRDRDGQERDLLAAARLERATVPLRLGYRTIMSPRLPAVVVSFGGLIGICDEDDAEALIEELRRPLARGKADLLILRNVVPGEKLHAVASRFRLTHVQSLAHRWGAPLPDTLDAFLQSRSAKSRQKLRREDRLLLAEYGERIELRTFSEPSHLDRICRDCETVAAKTYQRGLGAGFRDDPATRAFIALCLRQGRHRTWMLYIDGEPVAFWTGVTFNGKLIVTALGFDPAHSRYSVGRYTMFRMIEDLCADPQVTELDLGPGDADYKMAFTRRTRIEGTWLLASPSVRGVALVLTLSALGRINGWGRHILQERGWGARLKKAWRLRVTKRGTWSSAPDERLPEKAG